MPTPTPPRITLPPKKEKKQGTPYQRWINAHPKMKPYAQLIAKWAPRYGVDPIYLAALILFESGGNPNARSDANALGLAQIHLPSHPDVTEAQARNPAFAIKWAAQFFGQQLSRYGTYEAAYRQGYNPGYSGAGPFGTVPRGYVPTTRGFSPQEQAQISVETSRAREAITQEEFNRQWDRYNNIYYAYQGRKATKKEAQWLINNGFSEFTLARALTKNKAFYKSPIWESKAPEFYEVAKSIYGEQLPPGGNWKSLIAKAIANNWSSTTFAAKIRELPAYFKSNEFKKGEAALGNVYRSIFGEPDENNKIVIQEATLGRWDENQFGQYLRSLPEYSNSREFQAKRRSIAEMFGYLGKEVQNPNLPGERPEAPDSKRIPGNPNRPGYTPPPAPPPAPARPRQARKTRKRVAPKPGGYH